MIKYLGTLQLYLRIFEHSPSFVGLEMLQILKNILGAVTTFRKLMGIALPVIEKSLKELEGSQQTLSPFLLHSSTVWSQILSLIGGRTAGFSFGPMAVKI